MPKIFSIAVLILLSSVYAQDDPLSPPEDYDIEKPYGDQEQPIYYTKDFVIKVGSAEIGFYGFIKADYLGETRITGSTADIFPNNVPLDTDKADRKTQSLLDARSSRLGIKIEDTYECVLMKGAIEGDFSTTDDHLPLTASGVFGSSISTNGRIFRLRLAYASAELPSHFFFLTGQYHALSMHYPEIDMPTHVNLIHYPVGAVDSRQPQFRIGYKQYIANTSLMQYEINAEAQGYNNAAGFTTPQGGNTVQGAEQKWPLFNAKATWISDSLKWNIAFSLTRAYSILNAEGIRVNTPVWGVVSSGSYTWKNLILWGSIHHLVGLTGLSSGYFNQITVVDSHLKAVKANGGVLALRYDFIKGSLWTDVMYGVEHVNEIPGSFQFSDSGLRIMKDFRANLIGAFWKHWQIGLEYERNWVKSFAGVSGIADMVHLGVWYIFGQP